MGTFRAECRFQLKLWTAACPGGRALYPHPGRPERLVGSISSDGARVRTILLPRAALGDVGPKTAEKRHGDRAQRFRAVSHYWSCGTDPCGRYTPTFARNRSGSESRWSISSPRACSRNAIFGGETCTRARESVGAQSALLGELYRWVGSVTRVWTSHCG